MTEAISLDHIEVLRKRIQAGEQLTREELAGALQALRQDRTTASQATSKAKGSSKPQPIDLNSLFAPKAT